MQDRSPVLRFLCGLSLAVALLSPFGVASAAPKGSPPAPLALSAEEQAVIAQAGIVIRHDPNSGDTIGVVDVKAPPASTLAAVLDLSARAKEVTGLRAVEIYERGPSTLAARMEMGLAVYQARFHVTYAWDEASGWCTWELDPRHPNDITDTAGSYQVLPQGSGTRLVYRSHSGGGAMTPDWLKRKLAYSAARDMLSGMRTRAERGG